jgi:hypothetical protein
MSKLRGMDMKVKLNQIFIVNKGNRTVKWKSYKTFIF